MSVSTATEWITSIDPSTEEEIGQVPIGTPHDVGVAVEAGLRAQAEWASLPFHARSRALRAFADRITEHAEELAQLDARDSGNPISAMRNDVAYGAGSLELFAGFTGELKGQTIPASPGNLHYTVREPYGVVGRILPFNHPALFMCSKIAAPLAAGNAVVVKPAEQTPLSALRIAELSDGVLPEGLLGVVTGNGATGRALVQHPAIHRIGFTGGVPTGAAILRDAADGIKEVTLELGGKNPMIVLPDAELEATVARAVTGMNFEISAGQSCGSYSRILLHEDIYDEFTDAFIARVDELRVGPAVDEDTQMGPLITAAHRERVEGYIDDAVRQGLRLLTRGDRRTPQPRGYFVNPTVFGDVDPSAAIAREEIFGPVVSLMRWSDVDAMIEIANDVEYGLTANICTTNLRAAHTLASRVVAGYVFVNGDGRHYPGTPWGGAKASGLGREESIEETLSFTREKTVHTILS